MFYVANKMIDVLIVNESRLMCSVIAAVLCQEPDLRVIGCAASVEEAIEQTPTYGVMLVDAALSNQGALKLTAEINRTHPDVHIVVTGVEETPRTIMKYVEAGASGYVLNEVALDDLLENVRAAPEGRAYASPEMVSRLMSRISELAELCIDKEGFLAALGTLTPREHETLELISRGLTNQEIGEQLTIEIGTVKNHVHNILHKLNVETRQEAAELHQRAEAD